MKKMVNAIILFYLFFIFIPIVNAAEKYNLIYSITSLNVDTDSQVMTFKGFAFIDHMDNHGGYNLHTYIVASGGGKTPLEFEVNYDVGGYNSGDSYYYTRCVGEGCNINVKNKIKLDKRQESNCNSKTFGGQSMSDCAYFDVEFTKKIDLAKLYEHFGANVDIEFDIKVVNDIKNTVRTAKLGVHKQLCMVNDIGGTTCDEEINFGKEGNGKIFIGGMSENIEVTAVHGQARKLSEKETLIKGVYYDGTFQALGFENEVNLGGMTWWIHHYDYEVNYYIVNGVQKGDNIVNGGNTKYIIYDSWVRVEGQMSVRFGEMSVVEPEPTGYCPSEYLDTDISKTTKCNNKDVEFKSCKTYEVTFKAEYDLSDNLPSDEKYCGELPTEDIRVKFSILILEEGVFNFGSTADSVYAGKSFDFPDITYTNKIKWQFAKDSNNEKITSISIINGNGKPTNSKTVYYGKTDTHCVGGRTCKQVYDVATQQYITEPGCTPEACHDETYCDSDDGSHEIKLSDTVSYNGESGTINSFIKKKAIEKVKDMIKDYDNYSEEVIDDSDIKSYDSNNANSSLKKISDGISGVWKRVDSDEWNDENLKEDTYYSSTYEFDLYNSCVKLIGSDIGKVEYKSGTCSSNYKKYGSNAYFVPLQFENGKNKFKINIVENDISFVEGIEWNLSGTCSIDVKNLLYNDKSKNTGTGDNLKLRYRSISLEDPFPKGIIPANWSSWIAIDKNKKRLQNTYDNGIAYSISLRNGNSNGYSLGIDNINSDSTLGDYNDFKMNQDGTSKFIHKNPYNQYFEINANNSFCGIGKFSSTCDKYGS